MNFNFTKITRNNPQWPVSLPQGNGQTTNLWVAIEQSYWDDLMEAFNWDEEVDGPYPGPIDGNELLIISSQNDPPTVLPMFRQPTISTLTYVAVQTNLPEDIVPAAIAALDNLRSFVMGCWGYDGVQTGQTYVPTYDEDGNLIDEELQGTPDYPITSDILLFMPLVNTEPDPEQPPIWSEPTEPTDVNLRVGQAPRYWVDTI